MEKSQQIKNLMHIGFFNLSSIFLNSAVVSCELIGLEFQETQMFTNPEEPHLSVMWLLGIGDITPNV
jgi:hypothetical protein